MEIKKIKIEDLISPEWNPREITEDEMLKLKNSIKEFGYVNPIIVNQHNNHVVGGNQRLFALKSLDYNEVDVIFIDEPDIHREKALNIALNKISGDWDTVKLKEILINLNENDFDLSLTGFEEIELTDLNIKSNTEIIEDNYEEPDDIEVTVKKGDIYQLGNHRLMCGDATNGEDCSLLMEGTLADTLLTDPPYGVDYSSKNKFLNNYGKGNKVQKDIENDNIKDYNKFFTKVLNNIVPYLADYNTLYIFMSGQELHNLRLAIENANCKWGDYLVWVKNNHVLGRKDYNPKHEFYCFYGWYKRHKFYGGSSTTVLNFDKPLKNDLHPTMKPISLLSKLILDGTPENGTVLDVFGGSGSTLIACEETNRKCYMMELLPYYCQIIINRWEEFTGEKAVKIN